jgi:hypothetical protein
MRIHEAQAGILKAAFAVAVGLLAPVPVRGGLGFPGAGTAARRAGRSSRVWAAITSRSCWTGGSSCGGRALPTPVPGNGDGVGAAEGDREGPVRQRYVLEDFAEPGADLVMYETGTLRRGHGGHPAAVQPGPPGGPRPPRSRSIWPMPPRLGLINDKKFPLNIVYPFILARLTTRCYGLQVPPSLRSALWAGASRGRYRYSRSIGDDP